MVDAELRESFDEALEGLKHVHTREELEKARSKVFTIRDQLLKDSPTFREEVQRRREAYGASSDIQRLRSEADWIRMDAEQRRSKIMLETRMMSPPLRRIQDIVTRNAVKVGLVCPKCGDSDHGNKKNRKPWCFKCDLHLVSQRKAKKMMRWTQNIKVVKR